MRAWYLPICVSNAQPGGRLTGHHAAADDRDARRHLVEVGDVTRGPRHGLAQTVNGRYRRRGSGGDDNRVPGAQAAELPVAAGHLHGLLPGEPAPAAHDIDPAALRPLDLAGVVVV